MFKLKGQWYLYGITSYMVTTSNSKTQNPCFAQSQSFFSKVPNHISFINDEINNLNQGWIFASTVPQVTFQQVTTQPLPSSCGLPSIYGKVSSRIFNGENSFPNSFPWVVSIVRFLSSNSFYYICTGTLIDYDTVITVASCFNGIDFSKLSVLVGVYDLTASIKSSNIFTIFNYVISPNYVNPENGNDIALIKLNKPITISSNVNFICLPPAKTSNNIKGKNVTIVGW